MLQLVDEMKCPRPHLKMDKRMTGSYTIDDVLHEVSIMNEMQLVLSCSCLYHVLLGNYMILLLERDKMISYILLISV